MLGAPSENLDADKYYDVGRPDTVWIPGEVDAWVTNRPPICISLPKLVMVKKRFRRKRSIVGFIFAYSVMMIMFALLAVIVVSPVVGTTMNGRMDKLRALAVLMQGLIFFVPFRRLFHSFKIAKLGNGRGLLLGSEAFIDFRTLDAPVKWDDVQAIEEVCGGRTIIGLKMKLKNPCLFSSEYLDSIIKERSSPNYADQNKLYVDVGSFDDAGEIVKIIKAKSVHASDMLPWVTQGRRAT